MYRITQFIEEILNMFGPNWIMGLVGILFILLTSYVIGAIVGIEIIKTWKNYHDD